MTFSKYHKLRILGHLENKGILSDPEDTIIIEEKIDGANFRFMIKDGDIIFGSRTQQLEHNSGGNWKRCIEYIKDRFENKETKFCEGYIYYGECCVKHTMSYNWEEIPPFLGFDILSLKTGRWLGFVKRTSMFTDAALKIVPFIKKIKAKDMEQLTDKDVPVSKYASPSSEDQQAEGIVIKNYPKQLMAKYVREKFKEQNRTAFGGGKKFAADDDSRIVAAFCTNARIDKALFKLIDDGHKLDMPLMQYLPKAVTEDIYEEHWKDICFSSWSVNFKSIRKKITTRCLNVLKQVIINSALNKKEAE
jgi:hypothetical protein